MKVVSLLANCLILAYPAPTATAKAMILEGGVGGVKSVETLPAPSRLSNPGILDGVYVDMLNKMSGDSDNSLQADRVEGMNGEVLPTNSTMDLAGEKAKEKNANPSEGFTTRKKRNILEGVLRPEAVHERETNNKLLKDPRFRRLQREYSLEKLKGKGRFEPVNLANLVNKSKFEFKSVDDNLVSDPVTALNTTVLKHAGLLLEKNEEAKNESSTIERNEHIKPSPSQLAKPSKKKTTKMKFIPHTQKLRGKTSTIGSSQAEHYFLKAKTYAKDKLKKLDSNQPQAGDYNNPLVEDEIGESNTTEDSSKALKLKTLEDENAGENDEKQTRLVHIQESLVGLSNEMTSFGETLFEGWSKLVTNIVDLASQILIEEHKTEKLLVTAGKEVANKSNFAIHPGTVAKLHLLDDEKQPKAQLKVGAGEVGSDYGRQDELPEKMAFLEPKYKHKHFQHITGNELSLKTSNTPNQDKKKHILDSSESPKTSDHSMEVKPAVLQIKTVNRFHPEYKSMMEESKGHNSDQLLKKMKKKMK